MIIELTEPNPRAYEKEASPLTHGVNRSQSGTGPALCERSPRAVICCSYDCQGHECAQTRALLHKIAPELALLDSRVISLSQKDQHSSVDVSLPHHFSSEAGLSYHIVFQNDITADPTYQLPNPEEISINKVLQRVLDTLLWVNLKLKDRIDHSTSRSLDQNTSHPDTTIDMRKDDSPPDTRDENSPLARPYATSYHGFTSLMNSGLPAVPGNNPYSSEVPPTASSPHRTVSSSGSVFMAPHSPMQVPQPPRSVILPSPSSMNFTSTTNLLPTSSPPNATIQASAQSTFLQDLQHQISVKTIALQTLQREYDSLLQKLERQRIKCATLEKKFEVSDVEINNLTDEKEKLQAQVAAMEQQVKQLQESRDESRRQLVANGAQYMHIMEMANRLQAQSAADKKRWDAEKTGLRQRVKVLEEAMVTGTDSENPSRSSPPSIVLAHGSGAGVSSSAETVNVLRAEVGRLRMRTHALETALQAMKAEGLSIQATGKKLMEAGGKIEQTTRAALE